MAGIRKSYRLSAFGRTLPVPGLPRTNSLLLTFLFLTNFAPAVETAPPTFVARLVAAAIERSHHTVRYDGSYVKIAYPGGDVPADTGVCTDEIIRIYRQVGIDLQKDVYEDMRAHFAAYPHGLKTRPDPNIDHRRVPNLMVFFRRKGVVLPTTRISQDYNPGDVVTWDLGGGVNHIGMVVDRRGPSGAYMVVHNIGAGPQMEDVLFNWRITGHFRYYGSATNR